MHKISERVEKLDLISDLIPWLKVLILEELINLSLSGAVLLLVVQDFILFLVKRKVAKLNWPTLIDDANLCRVVSFLLHNEGLSIGSCVDDLLQILILEHGLGDDGVAELIRAADFDPLLLLADGPKLDNGVQLATFVPFRVVKVDTLNNFVVERGRDAELVLHTVEVFICDELVNGSFHIKSVAMLMQMRISLAAFYLMLSDVQTFTLRDLSKSVHGANDHDVLGYFFGRVWANYYFPLALEVFSDTNKLLRVGLQSVSSSIYGTRFVIIFIVQVILIFIMIRSLRLSNRIKYEALCYEKDNFSN